jgi:competence protein ComEC
LLVAQLAGIVAADRGWLEVGPALVLLIHASALGLAARGTRLRAFAALAVAFAAGTLALAARLESAARVAPAGVVEATAEARLAALRSGPTGWTAVLRDVVCAEEACPALPGALALRGTSTPERHPAFEAYEPGTRVRARMRLRAPPGQRNPGGRERVYTLARSGVGAEAVLVHPALHAEVEPPGALRAGLDRARRAGAARLAEHGRGGALLAALAYGEPSALSAPDREALARLGLSHLLAVSGLHVGLVAGLVWALARPLLARLTVRAPCRDARRDAVLVALAAAAVYAAVTGFGIPVRRALVLLAALAASFLRARPVPRGHPLALAALAILAVEPQALFDAGAQLSFAATAALVFAARAPTVPPAETRFARGRAALASVLRASATAVAATTPLVAFHLGRAAPFGWLANLVAVPLTGALVLPSALAAALLGAVAPEATASLAVARAASAVAASALGAAEALAQRVPGAEGLTPAAWALALATLVSCAALRARSTALRTLLAVAATGVLATAPPPRFDPPPPRVVFLDVGAGDAVVVEGRRGALLVDGGRAIPGGVDMGRAVVVPALRALGLRRLDVVVASHADLDHRGGLPAVVEALRTERVWLPPGGSQDPAFGALVVAAGARGTRVEELALGDPPRAVGDLHVEVLWPPRDDVEALGPNDRSLVLRIEAGGRTVLLPGDLEAGAEARVLAAGVPLRADVLKLAHHGSRTSSTAAWLTAVGGTVAVASAPHAGRFEKPHAEVATRTQDAGYTLWWTGRDGAVLIGLAPVLHVRGWRR